MAHVGPNTEKELYVLQCMVKNILKRHNLLIIKLHGEGNDITQEKEDESRRSWLKDFQGFFEMKGIKSYVSKMLTNLSYSIKNLKHNIFPRIRK